MSSYFQLVQSLTPSQILAKFPEVIPIAQSLGAPRLAGLLLALEVHFAGHDEEQIRLMDELCIVCDYNDEVVGAGTKKVCHLETNIDGGLLHRAFSVFLFNDKGELLLQQRADEKITFAQMWTNTCCLHPLAVALELGTTLPLAIAGAKAAAVRKLDHELGIPSEDVPLESFQYLTRIHYRAPSNDVWGEHEVDYILIARANPRLAVNPNEVKATKWVSQEELKAMFQDKDLLFTPWFKLICESYIWKWWDRLDSVAEFEDEEVHRME